MYTTMLIKDLTGLAEESIKKRRRYPAFIGISIRNKFFTKDVMAQYFAWASLQFSSLSVILMDKPDRHNLMIFKRLSKKEALKKSLEIAGYMRVSLERIISNMKVDNIKVLQFQDIENEPEYTDLN